MFAAVNPAFSDLSHLTFWYWAVPYIVAIILLSRFASVIGQNYILYTAIASLGLSFIGFLTLGRSALAYIVIDTLMLGACGINDLFWWSYLGEMLSEKNNPAKIMGIGLATNVAGVLMGEAIATLLAPNDSYISALVGLTAVFISLLVLPFLQKQIMKRPEPSSPEPIAADRTKENPAGNDNTIIDTLKKYDLTGREKQIVLLLLKGFTHQLIVSELMISESTVKTHIRNIYNKLNINNKTELIKKINE
jgi:DNA-binding CsgD family transcriptional regulator